MTQKSDMLAIVDSIQAAEHRLEHIQAVLALAMEHIEGSPACREASVVQIYHLLAMLREGADNLMAALDEIGSEAVLAHSRPA